MRNHVNFRYWGKSRLTDQVQYPWVERFPESDQLERETDTELLMSRADYSNMELRDLHNSLLLQVGHNGQVEFVWQYLRTLVKCCWWASHAWVAHTDSPVRTIAFNWSLAVFAPVRPFLARLSFPGQRQAFISSPLFFGISFYNYVSICIVSGFVAWADLFLHRARWLRLLKLKLLSTGPSSTAFRR